MILISEWHKQLKFSYSNRSFLKKLCLGWLTIGWRSGGLTMDQIKAIRAIMNAEDLVMGEQITIPHRGPVS